MIINWEAVIAICALIGTIGGVVHFTTRAVLNDFEKDLHAVFASKEYVAQLEHRITLLESK